MSSNPAFSDALARAKEIAARLTGKAAPANQLDKKRNLDGEEMDDNQPKRPYVSDAHTLVSAPVPATASALAPSLAPASAFAQIQVAARSMKTTIEFTVPSNKVGLVIGTRGETLKRMERATDTRINFEPPSAVSHETNERRVHIIGLPEDCDAAKRLIIEKVEEHSSQSGSARSPANSIYISRDAFGNPMPAVHFTIPNSKVGLCIGRGGETIRELQDRSGAKIYVAPDSSTSPDPNERLITVSGTEDCIGAAKSLIEEVLESGGVRTLQEKGILSSQLGSASAEPKASVTLSVPDPLIGVLIGKRGESFRAMVNASRAKITIDPPSPSGIAPRCIYISGAPECVAVAQNLIHERLSGTATLEGTTYVPVADPNLTAAYYADPSAAAAAYAADPYAYYYGPQYSQYQAYYADAGHAAVSAASPASAAKSEAGPVPPEALRQYYEYYYQYYAQAGCDPATASQAAQAALVAAGMPAYTGEDPTPKANVASQHDEKQEQEQQQQQEQEQEQREQESEPKEEEHPQGEEQVAQAEKASAASAETLYDQENGYGAKVTHTED